MKYTTASQLAQELGRSVEWVTRRAPRIPGAQKVKHATGICLVWQFPDTAQTRIALKEKNNARS